MLFINRFDLSSKELADLYECLNSLAHHAEALSDSPRARIYRNTVFQEFNGVGSYLDGLSELLFDEMEKLAKVAEAPKRWSSENKTELRRLSMLKALIEGRYEEFSAA